MATIPCIHLPFATVKPLSRRSHGLDASRLVVPVQLCAGLNPPIRVPEVPAQLRVRGMEECRVFLVAPAMALQMVLHDGIKESGSHAGTLPLRHNHQPCGTVGMGREHWADGKMTHQLAINRANKILGARRVRQV